MKTLLNQISEKSVELKKLQEAIAKAINELPDNPNIQRISEHPRCFVMSSKDVFAGNKYGFTDMRIRHNWSVFYHDFKAQYKKIAEVIERARPESVLVQLNSIINTGHLQGKDYVEFHPKVIQYLANLMQA